MVNRCLDTLNIVEPTLILDESRVRGNIRRMAGKAAGSGIRLRHHAKTHQSPEIGSWFREYGFNEITVSSLNMADYFAGHGWDDITVAFPVNIREIDKINHLATGIRLNLLVDSFFSVDFLEGHLYHPVGIWIKVDVGYHRSGLDWRRTQELIALAERIAGSRKLKFHGVLTHAGHTYKADSPEQIRGIFREAAARLSEVGGHIGKRVGERCLISVGDTPGCSLADNFNGIDEIRPGNFVFYDLEHCFLGACSPRDLALVLACPVVGKYPDRNQVVIYGGGVHLSKERLQDERGNPVYGYLAFMGETEWGPYEKQSPVISLSQEHGVVQLEDERFRQVEIGDVVLVVPVHVCLTANLYRSYTTLEGRRISRLPGCGIKHSER